MHNYSIQLQALKTTYAHLSVLQSQHQTHAAMQRIGEQMTSNIERQLRVERLIEQHNY